MDAATTTAKKAAPKKGPRTSAELERDVAAMKAEIPRLEAAFAASGLESDYLAIEAKRREADAADVLARVAKEREAAEKAAADDAEKQRLRARGRELHLLLDRDAMLAPHKENLAKAARAFEQFAIAIGEVFKADLVRHAQYDELAAIEKQLSEQLGPPGARTYQIVSGALVRHYFGASSFGPLLKDALHRRLAGLDLTEDAAKVMRGIFERGF